MTAGVIGRPRKFNELVEAVLKLHSESRPVREIAHLLQIPKSTVHRIIKRNPPVAADGL